MHSVGDTTQNERYLQEETFLGGGLSHAPLEAGC